MDSTGKDIEMNHTWHNLGTLLIKNLAIAALVGLFVGLTGFLSTLCLLFFYEILMLFRRRHQLEHYLYQHQPLPQGSGVWEDIFHQLRQKDKQFRKQENKLYQALSRFNRAAELLPVGIIVLSYETGRMEWFNSRAAQYLNLDTKSDNNMILLNVMRDPMFHHFLTHRQQQEVKICLKPNPEQERHLHILRYPFESKNELLCIADISLAEILHQNQNRFISNASHELRTPLTVLKGFIEHFLDYPELSQEQKALSLNMMQSQAQRMEDVLNDLLTLSRLTQQHHQEKQHQPLSLSALVRQIEEDCKALSQNQHQFIDHIAEDIELLGSERDLYSALSNIAFNAVRYTPAGGSITLSLYAEEKRIVFQVEDTGIGIAAEHIPRLTERFYQVQKNTGEEKSGTGLGLAICKHVLIEHEAQLDIESVPQQGSTFTVSFPNAKAL